MDNCYSQSVPFSRSNSRQPLATTFSLSWATAWITLPQGGKVTSGVSKPSPHSEPGVAPGCCSGSSSNPGTQRETPQASTSSCSHLPIHSCELRALAGALKALREGWHGQGLHQDTPVSPHLLYNCPFSLSPGHAAQDSSECCPTSPRHEATFAACCTEMITWMVLERTVLYQDNSIQSLEGKAVTDEVWLCIICWQTRDIMAATQLNGLNSSSSKRAHRRCV